MILLSRQERSLRCFFLPHAAYSCERKSNRNSNLLCNNKKSLRFSEFTGQQRRGTPLLRKRARATASRFRGVSIHAHIHQSSSAPLAAPCAVLHAEIAEASCSNSLARIPNADSILGRSNSIHVIVNENCRSYCGAQATPEIQEAARSAAAFLDRLSNEGALKTELKN